MALDYNVMSRISLEELILKLYDVDAVKFGSFTLKSGAESPVYIDLRVMVSFPDILIRVSEYLWDAAQNAVSSFSSVCGVPYTALPLATCISTSQNLPMLVRRKEKKDYGTKRMVEGRFKAGDRCLIVEDVVTSGSSVLETAQTLNEVGVIVKDAVVLLDREQGGRAMLEHHGIRLHSVLTVNQMLDVLESAGKINVDMLVAVKKYVAENRFDIIINHSVLPPTAANSAADLATDTQTSTSKRKSDDIPNGGGDAAAKKTKQVLRYSERAAVCKHALTKKLFTIMETKKSNLAFSVDVTSCQKALELIDQVGQHVCMVKTHVDILEDFSEDFTKKLRALAEKHNFLIFEDRKFADIGNTVKHQYQGGLYKISQWSHLVNAHSVSGPGVVKALKEVSVDQEKGCLLIAEMSSEGSMATGDYTQATVKMADEHSDFVMGFICQRRLTDSPGFVHLTPGVQLEKGGDDLGQTYLTPEIVIKNNKSDIIIVGRGILQAADPVDAAKQFQTAGYSAYLSQFPPSST